MTLRSILTTLLLILGGIIFALVLLTIGLMLFPAPVFGATSYAQRISANQSMQIEFKPGDGDLFVALPGSIRPPENNEPLERFTISWDADGFRNPVVAAENYPIAVFGDSFTEGFNVPFPWPDRLTEQLDIPVKNYGYRAYGPREVAQAVTEFAPEEARQWVIYAYFSGNDLGDAVRPPKIDVGSPGAVWSNLIKKFAPTPTPEPRDHYDFPMPVIIGGNYYEMVFLSYYLWWHLAPPEGFAASENFRVLSDSLDTMAAAVAPETCRAVVFIPTKEQLYYRYIYETERQWLRGVGNSLVIDEEGVLRMVNAPISEAEEAEFIEQLYGQRDAVRALVESKHGWHFIDLLPVFEAHVANGELLYYPYDSHWNQAGHDLAAAAIADALPDGCESN